jgi:predicted aminopeptidase
MFSAFKYPVPFQPPRLIGILSILILFFGSGCSLMYIMEAAVGQFRIVDGSVPVNEALKNASLGPDEKDRIRLVSLIKDFGEKDLGLRETRNYESVYLKSNKCPIYTVSASPKDRLSRKTWWFPIVGDAPYLVFFDLESARKERERLVRDKLDVSIGMAEAYSTLGWFRDPLTLSLIEGATVDLVETVLHEMTHTTLYVKGQPEFNEGLAVLVGKVGCYLFLKRTFGPFHPLTVESERAIQDERIFSSYINALLERLETLYDSSASYREKLAEREKIFSDALDEFSRLKGSLKTRRFTFFGATGLNNAYLLCIALYHRHFHLLEAVLKDKECSIERMLWFFGELSKEEGHILEKAGNRLNLAERPVTLHNCEGPADN